MIAWLILYAVLAAASSYCWSVVLVDDGMILAPVRARLYTRLEARHGNVEELWWWKPLWGCYRCNSVWVAWTFYAAGVYYQSFPLNPFLIAGFACTVLLLTVSFDKWLNS